MRRREYELIAVSAFTLGVAGCTDSFEDDPPDPPDALKEFFRALDAVDLDEASTHLHPDSPVDFDVNDLTLYDEQRVTAITSEWDDPGEDSHVIESGLHEEILDDEDRTQASALIRVTHPDQPRYQSEVQFEFCRHGDRWLLYDEIDGEVEALSPEPFPEH
ncbi:hypothetical protein [Halovivax gelatinilyticus]|uniref:hypothetical protein n=1 Tax=Halovivax gelatinilyticus TaxID=2961597 RepID=UPI0020CA2782|nr:hypothetical protein [Halovivax gelatinilyticus]